MRFELCCSNIHSVRLAELYRLEAIELCTCLEVGGLSPGPGLMETARELFTGQIRVLVRPRPGNFNYDELEQEVILKEISQLVTIGADAIVIGALDSSLSIDLEFMKKIIDTSRGIKLVFHRAIDVMTNPEKGLEQLLELQFDGILSSGTRARALEGAKTLCEWRNITGDAIEITAAGGITPQNALEIYTTSKADRLHASLKKDENIAAGKIKSCSANEIDEQLLRQMLELISQSAKQYN